MSTSRGRVLIDRVMVDLNTQCDFLLPRGALPVANRAAAMPNIRRLMNWARLEQVPVISSLEAHRPGESAKGMPPHCVDRTRGQRKLPFTLMPHRVLLCGDNTFDVPTDPFRRYQQIILTKRETDFLTNPKADRLINALSVEHWIIFGVTASNCVKAMVLGLLARHNRVVVVRDACGHWSEADGEHAFRMMSAKGAHLLTTDEVIAGAATRWAAEQRRIEFERTLLAGAGQLDDDDGDGDGDGVEVAEETDMDRRRARLRSPGNGKPPAAIEDMMPTHLLNRRRRPRRGNGSPTDSL